VVAVSKVVEVADSADSETKEEAVTVDLMRSQPAEAKHVVRS